MIILSWAMFSSVSSAEADAAPKQRREKKEAFKIDFLAPMDKDVKEIARELFAPPAKPGTILLPATGAGVARGTKRKRGKGKDRKAAEANGGEKPARRRRKKASTKEKDEEEAEEREEREMDVEDDEEEEEESNTVVDA